MNEGDNASTRMVLPAHREAIFAQQFARHCNGARAAREASYSLKGVNSRAAQLMANPRVWAVIQRRLRGALRRADLRLGP